MNSPLRVDINLRNLHCIRGSETTSSEPYLWTVFFKIDGDSVSIIQGTDFKFHMDGTATVTGTPGNHGNLGTSDVDDGDNVPIPRTLGTFSTLLKPIHFAPPYEELIAPGHIGCIIILMEENHTAGDAIAQGHRVLDEAVQTGLNDLIPTIKIDVPPKPPKIEDLQDRIESTVLSAIEAKLGVLDWFKDKLGLEDFMVGKNYFDFAADSLENTEQEIKLRITHTHQDDLGNDLVDIDWEITAAISGIIEGNQIVCSDLKGGLFHTIRIPDGSWIGFGDVKGQAGNPGTLTRVSSSYVGQSLLSIEG